MSTHSAWFDNCQTVNEIRRRYRELAFRWHPDRPGGDNETMKSINNANDAALQGRHGETSRGSDGKQHTYHYNYATEAAIMEQIAALLALRMVDVDIELIGTWLWISGDTKPHKEDLKGLGCRWHSKRVRWYWRQHGYKRRMNTHVSMDDIRHAYGSRTFEPEPEQQRDAVVTI